MSHGTCPVIRVKTSNKSQGDFVEINESDFDPKVHERYVAPPPAAPVVVPPPPPPGPVDPLAKLPANWKSAKTSELRDIATAVNGGRTPEERKQAIEIIEAALAARK